MTASRRSTDNVPAKKRFKEYSHKKTKKVAEQQILYDIGKEVFKRSLKFVDVHTRERKKENLFKIRVLGFNIIEQVASFYSKASSQISRHKFNFSGSINKNGREEVLIFITIFNQEGSYEARTPVVACQRSEPECFKGVFGQTEVRSHTTSFAS